MGFTRYWKRVRPSEELAEAAQKIIDASEVTIKGGFGEGNPIITSEIIWLNGDRSIHMDHETLLIDNEPDWRGKLHRGFCKTAEKPYDEVVAAILIAAAVIDDEVEVSRDGRFPLDDQNGIKLYEGVFGEIPDDVWERLR